MTKPRQDRPAQGAGTTPGTKPAVDRTRRRVVGATLLLGCAVAPVAGAMPGIPGADRANQVGFKDGTVGGAVERHFGTWTYAHRPDRIRLSVEANPRDGAIVPVVIESDLEAEEIAIVVEDGPEPLAAVFELPPGTEAYVSARVRVPKETKVVALVKKRNGTLHGVSQKVRARVPGFPD